MTAVVVQRAALNPILSCHSGKQAGYGRFIQRAAFDNFLLGTAIVFQQKFQNFRLTGQQIPFSGFRRDGVVTVLKGQQQPLVQVFLFHISTPE